MVYIFTSKKLLSLLSAKTMELKLEGSYETKQTKRKILTQAIILSRIIVIIFTLTKEQNTKQNKPNEKSQFRQSFFLEL